MGKANLVEADFYFEMCGDMNRTTVRFYDHGGKLTKLANRIAAVEKEYRMCVEELLVSKGLYRHFLNWNSGRLAGKKNKLRAKAHELAKASFGFALRRHRHFVAVRTPLRQFRAMREREDLRLWNEVFWSTQVSVFIFAPSQLNAEDIKGFGSILWASSAS